METSSSLAGRRFGRYQLVASLGRGGMGEVFEARHVDLGTRAAVKVIHALVAADQDATRRVLREGRATAAIRHPNVVSVLDVGTEQGVPYLIMELLEGENLARRLERDGPCSVEDAVGLLLPILAAVAAAHDAGIVHRDLKPSNVLLARRRDAIEPVVVDFGLSTWLDGTADRSTSSGVLAGTPQYMAPERLRGTRGAETRSDQYSLGVIAYECLTGGTPFWSEDRYELIHAIMTAEVVAPSTLNPRVPPGLDQVILRAMARDPGARFPDVRDFGSALLSFVGAPVQQRHAAEFRSISRSYSGFAGSVPLESVPKRLRALSGAVTLVGALLAVAALASRSRLHPHPAETAEPGVSQGPRPSVEAAGSQGDVVLRPPAAAMTSATTAQSDREARDESPATSGRLGPARRPAAEHAKLPAVSAPRQPMAAAPAASGQSAKSLDSNRDVSVERGTANIPIVE
jgi:serine/threonine-protein kinase